MNERTLPDKLGGKGDALKAEKILLVDLEEAYDWRMAWLEDHMIVATVTEEATKP